jgi:hypothetical protein
MDYILHNLPSKPQVEIFLLSLDNKPCPEPPPLHSTKQKNSRLRKEGTEVRILVRVARREYFTVKFALLH